MIKTISGFLRRVLRRASLGRLSACLLAALALSACAYDTRVREAGLLLAQNDVTGARKLLDASAAAGSPAAMLSLVHLRLSGKDPAPISENQAIDFLTTAAISVNQIRDPFLTGATFGKNNAYAAMLWFYASEEQRTQMVRTGGSDTLGDVRIRESLVGADGRQISKPTSSFHGVSELAGGPVPFYTMIGLKDFRDQFYRWPEKSRELTITDEDLLKVDRARAKFGDKYAQARMGFRYKNGRGVKKDARKAYRNFYRAAERTTPPMNCYYQAPVGDQKYGTSQCTPSGQPATPGLSEAQKEVCRAMFLGRGTRKNPKAARKWCKRAGGFTLLRELEAALNGAK